MRKIEHQMIEAIRQRKSWTSGNTSVWYVPASETGNPFGSRTEVHLHNNLIGEYWHGDGIKNEYGDGTVSGFFPCRTMFKRWPTRTTVSRLRALGINASVRKGKAMIDGSPV